MKLDDKKILDIVYTLLGILFFNVKKLCIFLGVNLKGFNYSTHVSDKNLIKKGLNYRRKPNYTSTIRSKRISTTFKEGQSAIKFTINSGSFGLFFQLL